MSKRYPTLEYRYPAVDDVNKLLHKSKLSEPKSTGDNGKNNEICDHDHPTDPVKTSKWKHDLYHHRHSKSLKRKTRDLDEQEAGPPEETVEERRLRLTLRVTDDRQYRERKGEKAKRLKEEEKAKNRALNAKKPRGRKPKPTKEEVWLSEGVEVAWVEKGVPEGSKEEAKQILRSQLQESREALDTIERERSKAASRELPKIRKSSGNHRRSD
ncbi:hypothetical protein M407DRAFT_20697 [Tulasnella calospora MUT 4182]|uniref:Uncharacterized protein n=1 Tax=Tulasnella calospora MUT 4182 TaxID=1051891 RepID=A0A0C3QPJ9_9AGAM|nr:hypothetical protein M407DRAFT_20697 [Tulasnella calospora MUT 4182]